VLVLGMFILKIQRIRSQTKEDFVFRDKKKIDSEFGKDNWINKRFILSVLSNFFDQKNSESIFFPILMESLCPVESPA
jgi:hypothetical protein